MMSHISAQLSWHSIRPEENRYRYYSLIIGPDLWGQQCIIRRWGRIWGGNREKFIWVDEEPQITDIIRETNTNRLRHGYRLRKGDLGLFEAS